MFPTSVEYLLNNLLRFFKHKLKMSKTIFFFFKWHPVFIIALVESFFAKIELSKSGLL
jgi:hypothetical protein